MIFQHNTVVVFEGSFTQNRIRTYEHPETEVTFQNLSEKMKIAALRLGYSPAITLSTVQYTDNSNSDYWILHGETLDPYIRVYLFGVSDGFPSKLFFDPEND
ncbi:MAG: hypothetical protein RMX63_34535 [Aulosira sp. ZfuCHP01]|nr:hypothetical protein [Aulosira sp. ZfuVER01]MDZ8002348.1 hypothetical protein [Aulosira sp. DedVER01a]MDZ8056544.1 hypothetical protein [Aulosira sp. ZfuCHP01]